MAIPSHIVLSPRIFADVLISQQYIVRNLRENKKRKEKRKKENKTTQSTVSMGGGVTYSFCRARAHIGPLSILNLGPQKRVSCPRARHLKPPASSLPPPLPEISGSTTREAALDICPTYKHCLSNQDVWSLFCLVVLLTF